MANSHGSVVAMLALAGAMAVPVVPPGTAEHPRRGGGVVLIGPPGSPSGQIVLPALPGWTEAAAAAEISARLLQATGVNLTVVSEANAAAAAASGMPRLFVGRTKELAAVVPHPQLSPEGYAVFVSAGAGYLVGDDHCNITWPNKVTDNSECRRGTLFGAFALLRHLGFAWLWPGEGGQVTPALTADGVTLSAGLNLSDAPELSMRRYRPIYSNTGEVDGRYEVAVPWLINRTLLTQLEREESLWLLRAGMRSHDTPAWGQAFESWWDDWGDNGTLGHHPQLHNQSRCL